MSGWFKVLFIIGILLGGSFYLMSPERRSEIVGDIKDKFKSIPDKLVADDVVVGSAVVGGGNVSVLFYGKPRKPCITDEECLTISLCEGKCLCDVKASGDCFVVEG